MGRHVRGLVVRSAGDLGRALLAHSHAGDVRTHRVLERPAAALCASVVSLTLQVGIHLTVKGLPWYIDVVMLGAVGCLPLSMIPESRAVKRAIRRAYGSPQGRGLDSPHRPRAS